MFEKKLKFDEGLLNVLPSSTLQVPASTNFAVTKHIDSFWMAMEVGRLLKKILRNFRTIKGCNSCPTCVRVLHRNGISYFDAV